jgi:tRNA pseudouridine38-40 synthase|tara:strand:- start:56 stop:796 length:741 start_codon:yes stop_codon:yes gene_type:complete
MFRYQILIEYNGTKFKGWQLQPKGISVQGVIEKKLSRLVKEKIKLIGAGRTDRGVHALLQSAHFDTKKPIKDKLKFLNSLNFFLKENEISVISIKKRNDNFHARYSAKKRIYKYIILNRLARPSLQFGRVWFVIKKLDIKNIKKGAKILEGIHDFSAYRSSKCSAKSPKRRLDYVKVKKMQETIIIRFQSKSFLQQQVRGMVGCLKYLAEGKWNIKKFKHVLVSKKRDLCAPPAPPEGLYLEKVIY